MYMRAIDPPRESPPRRWHCKYCGDIGLYEELRARPCAFVYPPCEVCGQTPECAADCAGVLAALGAPGVVVISSDGLGAIVIEPKVPDA